MQQAQNRQRHSATPAGYTESGTGSSKYKYGLGVGIAAEIKPVSLTGGTPTSCTSTSGFPSGLTINSTTCVISGTPSSSDIRNSTRSAWLATIAHQICNFSKQAYPADCKILVTRKL